MFKKYQDWNNSVTEKWSMKKTFSSNSPHDCQYNYSIAQSAGAVEYTDCTSAEG